MVGVKIIQDESDFLSFELIGDTHTLSNLLRRELWNVDSVEHASYELAHPQVGHPLFRLKVNKGKPRKALFEALENIQKKNKDLRSSLKKL